jgi:hypothetical protein
MQRIFLTIVCGIAVSTMAMIGTKADPEACREEANTIQPKAISPAP